MFSGAAGYVNSTEAEEIKGFQVWDRTGNTTIQSDGFRMETLF